MKRYQVAGVSLARRSKRQGLTLIELVVVLTILVALGGLIVPVLPAMIARTHFAKCSATIPEVTKLWVTSFATKMKYPDGYDSLIEGTGLFTELPGPAAGGELIAGTLTANEAEALAAIGVRNVYNHTAATGNATYDSPDYTTVVPLADGVDVAILSPGGGSVNSLGIKTDRLWTGVDAADVKLVVFGIGNGCTGVGPSGLLVEAPTHFGGEDAMNPVENYQRYCVIFAVTDGGADGGRAKFVCAASIHPDGLDGAEAHIRAYYEEQQGDS